MTMTSTEASVELDAWKGFLRSHAAITRALNSELLASHRLTLNDYEVLLVLAHAPNRRLRRVDLAERLLLTASGITRLLEGLERAGLVCRAACATDARVVYAELTDEGYEELRSAASSHLDGIHRLFGENFTDAELATLAELLGRLPGNAPAGSCAPPDPS